MPVLKFPAGIQSDDGSACTTIDMCTWADLAVSQESNLDITEVEWEEGDIWALQHWGENNPMEECVCGRSEQRTVVRVQ